jgi:hypothetical protein
MSDIPIIVVSETGTAIAETVTAVMQTTEAVIGVPTIADVVVATAGETSRDTHTEMEPGEVCFPYFPFSFGRSRNLEN